MGHVADQVEEFVALAEKRAEDRASGRKLPEQPPTHMLFNGPPGTGKTTVATNLTAVLHALGEVKENKLVTKQVSEMLGSYKGDAEANMTKALKEAEGGVLFIDEAHQMADTEYGQALLRTLIGPMGNKDSKTLVILGGYTQEMPRLFRIDPGLRSRITKDLDFEEFAPDDLEDFTASEFARQGLKLDKKATAYLGEVIDDLVDRPNYASMRDAVNLVRDANASLQVRARRAIQSKTKIKDRTALRETVTAADLADALARTRARDAKVAA